MIISFAWTTPAILAKRKTCTRREWTHNYAARFHAGDVVEAYDRQPRFGGEKIATLRLTADPLQESTARIPESDWEAEGFAYLTQMGTLCGKSRPIEIWEDWQRFPRELYVVRFEILDLANNTRHHYGESPQDRGRIL